MRITYELLKAQTPPACDDQANEFRTLFPDGCEPTVENLMFLANHEWMPGQLLDVFWLIRLLPEEGPGSMRAFALWCAEEIAPLCDDQRVRDCLSVVRRRVDAPGTCTDAELDAARDAAWDAAWAAAGAAAWDAAWAAAGAAARDAAWAAAGAAAGDAARDAARAAAWDAARDAQIACLSQLLMEAP
jgi:hypothetical protein